MGEKSNEIPRVQITLDSYVAGLIIGMEARRDYGENRKEITNNILRDWFRTFLKDEDVTSGELLDQGLKYIEQIEK